MASEQLVYEEQEPSNGDQNINIKIEENEKDVEDYHEDDEDNEDFVMPEHFLYASNIGIPLTDEQKTSIMKRESDRVLNSYIEDVDKGAEDSDEGEDVNYVVGASAETLMTLSHTHETGRKRVKYSCNVCEKEFRDKRICLRHVRTHTGEKPYQCYQCGDSFGNEGNLSRHMSVHSGDKPFTCPKCYRDFSRKATLEQHLIAHTNMSERPFPCDQCDKGYVKRSHLERHLKTHSGVKEFICSVCGKGCSEKRHLIDHMRRRHSDRKMPTCTICDREFKSEFLLKTHMNSKLHKGDKFKNRYSLGDKFKNLDAFKTSEEQLLESLQNFVSKDVKESQANQENTLLETSDKESQANQANTLLETSDKESQANQENTLLETSDKESQANPDTTSLETYDSHSLYGNKVINDGVRVKDEVEDYQKSDAIEDINLANSIKEEL